MMSALAAVDQETTFETKCLERWCLGVHVGLGEGERRGGGAEGSSCWKTCRVSCWRPFWRPWRPSCWRHLWISPYSEWSGGAWRQGNLFPINNFSVDEAALVCKFYVCFGTEVGVNCELRQQTFYQCSGSGSETLVFNFANKTFSLKTSWRFCLSKFQWSEIRCKSIRFEISDELFMEKIFFGNFSA